ncbi:MAG: S1C family serine protease [Halobacteriota archaeon]
MSKKVLAGAVVVALLLGVAAGFAFDAYAPSSTTPDSPPLNTSQDPSFEEGGYVELYRLVSDSVVSIRVDPEDEPDGLGSGFVYDEEGRIVTNEHVVGNESEVEVRFLPGDWRTASVRGTDVYTDLAVLDVDDPPGYAEALPVTASPPPHGTRIAALGNPQGLEGSLSAGVVAGLNRSMPAPGGYSIPDTVQIDGSVAQGMSGGPIVSMDGEVIGVTSRGQASIGFGVSGTLVDRVVPDLIAEGEVEHPHIGIRSLEVTPDVAEENDLEEIRGVMVVDVVEDGPAEGVFEGVEDPEADVPRGGDVILSMDGVEVDSSEELARVLMVETEPGESVEFEVLRDGEVETVEVTMGVRPPPEE